MSDVQSRPAVARGGRGSAARGGRGGFSSRGPRNAARGATNGDAKPDQESTSLPTLEDQGEIADLNKAYGSKIEMVKGIFPDWSDVDILYALKETDGDETSVIERIIDGSISQWGEVSQKKDRTKAKSKDTFTTTTGADVSTSSNRLARGGRPDAARGRGRATERGGRGAPRSRSAAAPINGSRPKENQPLSVPTEESSAWDTTKNNDDGGWASAAAATAWEPAAAVSEPAAPAPTASANPPEPAKSAVIPSGTSKTWASMLRQSVVPKPALQPVQERSAPQPEPALEPLPAAIDPTPATEPEADPEPIAELSAEPPTEHSPPADETTVLEPEVALPPSNDQLTKTNLKQVEDNTQPPATETVASEAADSWDPRASATATPISASQAQHQAPHKAPASGYAATAATAIKATERVPVPRAPVQPQRRFLDQQEAVRMPGAVNNQIERATLQFGAFNLNGTEEDIDGDREEPETRAQPPADSPVAQPRASLPPAPQQAPDAYTAQKPVSTLPTAVPTGPQPPAAPAAPAAQQPTAQVAAPQIPTQPAAQQYGRYGQPTSEHAGFPQKPFDSYNQTAQPATAPSNFDTFPGQQQAQSQPQNPSASGPYSSAPDPFSTYYPTDPQSRGYGNYYGYGGQQAGQGHESGLASRGGFAGYGAAQGDLASQYPQSANQSRYGAAVAHDQNSGPSTPVPQATQGPPASQAHAGQQQHGYYGNQNQYYQGQYAQQNYGGYNNPNAYGSYGGGGFGGYGGKAGGAYGQHYQQQQQPYDPASTGAAGYPQSSLHRADSGGATGLGDYSRTGAAQPGGQPGLGATAFGGSGIHDTFARGSSYGAQASQPYNAASTQPGSDDLKPFGDGKTSGPSPAMVAGARPGSATNPGPTQGGLPPPQSQQGMGQYAGFGVGSHGLQGHGLHGAQSGSAGYGMGAQSAPGQQQNTPYSGYGGFGGGNNTYSNYAQQQQHRGGATGWGNQYGGGGNGGY